MKLKLPERRRFLRIETPLKLVLKIGGRILEVDTKNISPVGLRFEVSKELEESRVIDISLYLPEAGDPIRLKGKVIWQDKVSLEDNAPYDVGVEITDIDDKNKKVFLKYLCDLLYISTYKTRT
ncbi:MAG: PilZ domain-containing protein [Candidatus Omnitrophota bacterium]|nr:PilZ domain-containing protein [Candidatus Omnitrophota bacterium]